jgi:UDP-glucose 4-epimerase
MGRFLITGGAGFIGSHLVHALRARGEAVRVLDDLSASSGDRLPPPSRDCELVIGTVCDPDTVERCLEGVDRVVHLAARVSVHWSMDHPEETMAVNAGGTGLVLDAAARVGVDRLVLASSCAVYGDPDQMPVDESCPASPASPYAASKLAAEERVLAASGQGAVPGVALRFFNVYGPGQDPASPYAAVIPLFARAILRGDPITVFGDGRQSRDFVFVGDVVQAILAASRAAGGVGRALNVGTGVGTSLQQLLRQLEQLTGLSARVEQAAARPGDVRHSRAAVEAAGGALGFRASTPLLDGLRLTLEGPPAGVGGP